MEQSSGTEFVIREPPNRCMAGQLTLPCVMGGKIDFVDLLVPSNGRFTQDDLRSLWEAGAELAAWRSARKALARRYGDFGELDDAGPSPLINDWRALTGCAHDAANLLRHWPTQLDRKLSWLPVGVPGGTEDLLATAYQAERRGGVINQDETLSVAQSARWLGSRRPSLSAAVSALAAAVVDLVRQSVPATQWNLIRPLLDPIGMVSRAAAVPVGYRDPDPSSWPVAFISFAVSCMITIAELQSFRRGKGAVPLLDTDELYEAWLAARVRAVLDDRFGTWRLPYTDALAAWEHDDTTYELWLKPAITRYGKRFGQETFQAVVTDLLMPDLLIAAIRGEKTELAVVDAKAWAVMESDSVLTQGGKYLYGIRRAHDEGRVPAIVGVDIVTCASPPVVSRGDLAKVWVTAATPTSGGPSLSVRIGAIVDALTTLLAEREQRGSGPG